MVRRVTPRNITGHGERRSAPAPGKRQSGRRGGHVGAADAQEHLAMALTHSPLIGTWDWLVPQNKVFTDARLASMFGVDPAAGAAGAPVESFLAGIHPDDVGRVRIEIDAALTTGQPFSSEFRLRPANGVVQHVLARGQCVLGAGHAPARFPGVVVDITERAEAESRLRQLNEDLERKVIERTQARGRTWQVSPDLLGALNSKGYFETSNPAWKSVLGWSEEEVASTSIFELLHPDDVERTRAGFNLTQIGQPAIGFPNRYRRKDGSYRWISWIGVPDEGLVYCSGRDITSEKTAEANLLDERDVSALREQFIAVLGHDLRNPLAAINAGIRRLKKSNLGEHNIATVAMMGGSVSRMAELIDNVMDFTRSRLGGGLGVTFGAPEQAEPILLHVMAELQLANPNRSIKAEIAAPDLVTWDRGRIGQLVSNLVGNAVKHGAADQPIRLTASTKVGWFELNVANGGRPIAPALLERIFKPFTRGEALAERQGLGLGLYISSEIARAHHGTLTVASTKKETCFTFRMPIIGPERM